MSPIDSPRESCSSSPRRTIGVAAQLGDADLEGDPRPRRGLLEDEGDAAPGQRVGADAARARPAFSSSAAVEQLAELERAQLFAGEEVALARSSRGYYVRVEFTAIAWNLFHGRDFPPDPALLHLALAAAADRRAQRHPRPGQPRPAATSSPTVLAGAEWDVALLQECPPRFAAPLAARLRRRGAPGADLAQLRSAPCAPPLARLNPDLIASGEGGSNLTLVRRAGQLGGIAERRELAIHEGQPERRAMALHPHRLRRLRRQPARDQRPPAAGGRGRAARRAGRDRVGRRARRSLFGGDLNLRPARAARASSSGCASASASAAPTAPRRDRPPARRAASRSLEPPAALAARAARARRSTGSPCGSPTTPRSRRRFATAEPPLRN